MPRRSFIVRPLTSSILALTLVVAWNGHSFGTRAESALQVPDACTFIPKADLENLIGRELRTGIKKDVAPPMSQCSFETPPDAYVTRKFDNPPLPPAAGFQSLTVTTFQTSVPTFAESRKTMGGGSPEIPGIGDGAFLSGPAMIFARVGTRGFSIRVYSNAPTTDAGRARLNDVMVSLAKAGVAKLK